MNGPKLPVHPQRFLLSVLITSVATSLHLFLLRGIPGPSPHGVRLHLCSHARTHMTHIDSYASYLQRRSLLQAPEEKETNLHEQNVVYSVVAACVLLASATVLHAAVWFLYRRFVSQDIPPLLQFPRIEVSN